MLSKYILVKVENEGLFFPWLDLAPVLVALVV